MKEEERSRLEYLEVYKLSVDLSEKIWNLVKKWAYIEKNIQINIQSKQLFQSIDSMVTNLSEENDRLFYKENPQKVKSLLMFIENFLIINLKSLKNLLRQHF